MTELCIEYTKATRYRTAQPCSRRAGHGPDGLYCRQHAKKHDAPPTPIPPGLKIIEDPADDVALHPPTVLGLCAGSGALELGLDVAVGGARGVCYVEREAYAAALLVARMEEGELAPAPVWGDIGSFSGAPWRGVVDLVTSGDPCQPNSGAGRGLGKADDRWLLDQILRIVDEVRPRRFFRENVAGNAAGQLAVLVPALEGMGYRVAAGFFRAMEVGAAHQRERLFVLAELAEPDGREFAGRGRPGQGAESPSSTARKSVGSDIGLAHTPDGPRGLPVRPGKPGETDADSRRAGEALADPGQRGLQRDRGHGESAEEPAAGGGVGDAPGRIARRVGQPGESEGREVPPRGSGYGRGVTAHVLADAGGPGSQGTEQRASREDGTGPGPHGPAAECGGAFLFAPGPGSPDWPGVLDADPLLEPAIGNVQLWTVARRALGLPPLGDAVGRRGGMARDMDAATTALAKSLVRRMADGTAPRVDRLRVAGNGVVPLEAAYAYCALDAVLAAARAAT